MKKRFMITVVAMLLMLAAAGVAFAEQSKQIQVWLDGKELAFEVEPLVQNNVTYVEFRGLLTALDYEITYDSAKKQIRGVSGDGEHTIEMTSGSSNTLVNGQLVKGQIQPLISNGRTLIPLRFVGEATGLNVEWNGSSREITLTTPWPNAKDYAQLNSFLEQLGKAQSSGKDIDIRALLNPNVLDNAATYSALIDHVGQVEIESTYQFTEILYMTATETLISATNESRKVSGGFFLDRNSNLVLELSRERKGDDWKLDRLRILAINYTNIDVLMAEEPTMPAEEKEKIIGILEEQIAASNAEDIKRYEATFAPGTPGLKEAIALSKAIFEQFDLRFELADVQIIYYDGTEAYIHFTQTTTKLKGPSFKDNQFEGIAKVIKLDNGTWRVTNETLVLDMNELE